MIAKKVAEETAAREKGEKRLRVSAIHKEANKRRKERKIDSKRADEVIKKMNMNERKGEGEKEGG